MTTQTAHGDEKQWIRGVNMGGWLLAEQFITPYLFAVNTCHMEGELCWYEGQIGAPEDATICDPEICLPVQKVLQKDSNADFHPLNAKPYVGYPVDEMTIGQTFDKPEVARKYMERHWNTFVTRQNLLDLKEAGITHLRVPMGFWIRGDIRVGEPWIDGAWPYFVRFAKWCREIGLEIWADLHGAPGSQNGFDNSGQSLELKTCKGWSDNAKNVERTVDIVTDIANSIVEEGIDDVVTGFGLLNEPLFDCDEDVLRNYYNQGFKVVRDTLGSDTAVFVGDMFQGWRFNDGFWGTKKHKNTFLDTHEYHVFFEKGRAFTPLQHIAYLCRHNSLDVNACCYEDGPNNTIPSKGISRIVGEWSAAYDQLPTGMAPLIMKTIEESGTAPFLNRTLSKERIEFMRNFVEAQMVVYEAKTRGISNGWFFWNFQMENGAYAEWDFLRGIEEGWMPKLPDPTVASEDVYGTCLDIYNKTSDDYKAIVDEFPDPRDLDWRKSQGWVATDDFVLSDPLIPDTHYGEDAKSHVFLHGVIIVTIIAGVWLVSRRKKFCSKRRNGYNELK